MMLRGAKVYRAGQGFTQADVRIEGERIAEVGADLTGGDVRDLSGYLVPGMIDIHTHGYGGADAMQGEEAVLSMSDAYVKHGVTAFLPTTTNAPIDVTARAVAGIERAMARAKGARVLGAHVEGPFIEGGYKGALLESAILTPSPLHLSALCAGREREAVRLLTMAPELPGAEETIRFAASLGIVVSLGHTAATYEQATAGLDWGATQFTHLFNAMTPIHHREPGVPTAALLDERATVQLIADGVHTHPAILKLVARLKKEGICLITDSMMAAGLGDGTYELGGQAVYVSGGEARLLHGNLAGSVLTMDEALRRMIRYSGLPLEEVVPMTGEIPARSLGRADLGVIAPGALADLCLLDEDLTVAAAWVGGREAYRR